MGYFKRQQTEEQERNRLAHQKLRSSWIDRAERLPQLKSRSKRPAICMCDACLDCLIKGE